MQRKHCDFCNVELGRMPPFFVGESIWNTLVTPKSNWEYCMKHQELVEEKLNKLKLEIFNITRKSMEDENNG